MRSIDMQDSVYRAQPAEKVQGKIINQVAHDTNLNHMKKGDEDEIKDTIASETEKTTEEKVTDREKRDREFLEKKKKREEKKEKETKEKKKRSAGTGGSILDIDA